ncbi:MAG: hypothetical protein O3B87_05970 [bacterium]|nr:hypothetical protein [bacterium]
MDFNLDTIKTMPKLDTLKTSTNSLVDDDYDTPNTLDVNDDNTDNVVPADVDDNEEAARDDYLNKLGKIVEQVQDELESESNSDDSISVDPEKLTDAIETLSELLHIRAEQLAEKELPPHVDEKVEEYR